MRIDLSTCWELIHGAARGEEGSRRLFAERYQRVVRGYLDERWRRGPLAGEIEDAVQEVFVDCLRADGALQRADQDRGEFRGFLFGIVRTVALRFERARGKASARHAEAGLAAEAFVGDDAAASRIFDREWALAMLRLAVDIHRQRASELGPEHARRVDLLRLRFEEGLPIRDIAVRWQCDPAALHHEFARARRDFKQALAEAMGLGPFVTAARLDSEVAQLWQALR